MVRLSSLMGVDTRFDPTFRFETSWLVSSRVLFGVRGIISIYAFFVSFFIIGWQATHGNPQANRRSFSFFTVLSYWGLAFYFLFAALHTWSLVRYGQPFLNTWPRALQALHSLYYTTVVTLPLLVTVVYWAILFDGSHVYTKFRIWTDVSQHALNAFFALLEILLPRTSPPPIFHLLPLLIILALYLALAYLTHATQGFYTYDFLDPSSSSSGRVTAYVFGLLAVVLLIFGLVWSAIWFRRWLTDRRWERRNRRGRSATVRVRV